MNNSRILYFVWSYFQYPSTYVFSVAKRVFFTGGGAAFAKSRRLRVNVHNNITSRTTLCYVYLRCT